MPVYDLLRAVIPDFRGAIWESLQGYCPFTPLACSDSLFEGVNLGIAARLCPFTSSCVQRFLISGQDLRIDAAEKSSACSGRSGNEVRVRFYSSLPQRRMVPPAVVVAATRSASDSFLRSGKEEQPAYSGRSGNEVRVRFYSPLPQGRTVSPATVVAATRPASDSILRCLKGERFRLQDAVADAGGGRMHEGGIALSKKPPEWYLSPL